MLVLHGAWGVERGSGDAAFLVWAEADEGRAPPPASDGVPPHPFQAAGARVRRALDKLAALTEGRLHTVSSSAASWTIRLPSRDGRPLPSPEALATGLDADDLTGDAEVTPGDGGESGSTPSSGCRPVLGSWAVRGRAVPASEAVWLLALLPADEGSPSPGLAVGTDVRYWSAAAKLALELVARERFVPTLEIRNGARARWRPVLADPRDAARFSLLVRAMPPACRATGESAPAAGTVLERALGAAVDALVVAGIADGVPAGERKHLSRPSSASEAWMAALEEGHSLVPEGAYDLGAFAERVASWIEPVAGVAAAESLRTCFRLEPPEEVATKKASPPEARAWTLRFLLQAADDPSLLVSAERVWDEQGDALEVFSRRLDRPQERFLADLGRAAQLFPPLEIGLAVARPAACRLTTEEAYGFLREAAPLLEESGFGVLVPSWWTRQGARQLGVRVKLGTETPGTDGQIASGVLGRESLV
ncbi:MAG: SNF2 helicase-associated domain-containing protein, partial [Chloroflexota bacterium]|nr:SNF2 helicase-associated domain-containing protein [Chloroflexota bacterium]